MNIHIMGASCAGSTTLGNALGRRLNIPYLDTDDYFWAPSKIPYTIKRAPVERINMLKNDVEAHTDCIVGGSLVSWGDEWKELFDLIVFLYIPQDIRLERLKAREFERYGDQIYTDPERIELYRNFMEWAAKYEDRTFTGRNLQLHEDWLNAATGKVVEIRGDTTIEERMQLVLAQL
jgi:adenylate kinase family enzyme